MTNTRNEHEVATVPRLVIKAMADQTRDADTKRPH